MRLLHRLVCVLIAGSCALVSPAARAAAQLKAGAKTSAAVTATNPALRQIQMTFDPEIVSSVLTLDLYNVQSFDLGLTWDPTLITYVPGSVSYIAPFAAPVTGAGPTLAPGVLSGITGTAPRASTVPGDVDLFSAWFQLKPGIPIDKVVSVTFTAIDSTDFIHGINTLDPNNPAMDVTAMGPVQVESATASGAVGVAAVPLPSGAGAGLAALAVLIPLRLLKRNATGKVTARS